MNSQHDNTEYFELSELINKISEICVPEAKLKGLEFVVEQDSNLPDYYYGNEFRIRQVLDILILNAIKHTPEGLVYLRISGEVDNQKARLNINVTDTGIGIREDRIASILKTGPELLVVSNVLAIMNSELKVKSVYGIGAQFYMTIELQVADVIKPKEDIKDTKSDVQNSFVSNLPVIDGIDWAKASVNLPEEDLLLSIVGEFYHVATDDIGELQSYYDDGVANDNGEAWKNYQIKVHALKNSAALIGAIALSEEAKALEYASRDNNIDYIITNHAEYTSDYMDMARRTAAAFGESIDDYAKTPVDMDVLQEHIKVIKLAMDDMDIEELNNTMEQLEKYEYEPELDKAIIDLGESILTINRALFDASIERIENIMAE